MKTFLMHAMFLMTGTVLGAGVTFFFCQFSLVERRPEANEPQTLSTVVEADDEPVQDEDFQQALSKLSVEEIISGAALADIGLVTRYIFAGAPSAKMRTYAKEYVEALGRVDPSQGRNRKLDEFGRNLIKKWAMVAPEETLAFLEESPEASAIPENIKNVLHYTWIQQDQVGYGGYITRLGNEALLYKGYGMLLESYSRQGKQDAFDRLFEICDTKFSPAYQEVYGTHLKKALAQLTHDNPESAMRMLVRGRYRLMEHLYGTIISAAPLELLNRFWAGMVNLIEIDYKRPLLKMTLRRLWEEDASLALNGLETLNKHPQASRLYFGAWEGNEVPTNQMELFLSWLEAKPETAGRLQREGYLGSIIGAFCTQNMRLLGSLLGRFELSISDIEDYLRPSLLARSGTPTAELAAQIFEHMGHEEGMGHLGELIHYRCQGDVHLGLSDLEKYMDQTAFPLAVAAFIDNFTLPEDREKIGNWLLQNSELFDEPEIFRSYANGIARQTPEAALSFLGNHAGQEHKDSWAYALKQYAYKGEINQAFSKVLDAPLGPRTKKSIMAELLQFSQSSNPDAVKQWLRENPSFFTAQELKEILQ